MTLDVWLAFAETVQAFVTTAAVVVGGIWTYRTFFRERLKYTKVITSLGLECYSLSSGNKLLHVTISLSNIGKVKFGSTHAELRLRQVVPAPKNVEELIGENVDPVNSGATEIEWPVISQRAWTWSPGEFEIEPGEGDALHADFGVPADVEVVELYFYVKNEEKAVQNIGWSVTELFQIAEKGAAMNVSRGARDDSTSERQQKQQKPQSAQQQQQQQNPKSDQAQKGN